MICLKQLRFKNISILNDLVEEVHKKGILNVYHQTESNRNQNVTKYQFINRKFGVTALLCKRNKGMRGHFP